MRYLHIALATLALALIPNLLSAQVEPIQQSSVEDSTSLSEPPASAPPTPQIQTPPRPARTPHRYFLTNKHPLTPREVSMREAVESLGIDKHRFVLCELKDGSHFLGGIGDIKFATFRISKGIMNSRDISYSELKEAPQPVPAIGEHLANGLKWTGLVAACVVFSPLVIVFYPLVLAGVITD